MNGEEVRSSDFSGLWPRVDTSFLSRTGIGYVFLGDMKAGQATEFSYSDVRTKFNASSLIVVSSYL